MAEVIHLNKLIKLNIMENSFSMNGYLRITMKPTTQEWKHLMELVKDGDEFTVTKANNTTEVVFTRTGNKNSAKVNTLITPTYESGEIALRDKTFDKTPRE